MHVELMQELNSASQIEVMWIVQLFAQVIVHINGGLQAFIMASGPDVMLTLNMASTLNFFHVHTLEGPQRYVWGEAIVLLAQAPETAHHRLLAILEQRENFPSQFMVTRDLVRQAEDSKELNRKLSRRKTAEDLKGWLDSRKRNAMLEAELKAVSRWSSRRGINWDLNF
jgi:hypothetical protein